MGTTPRNEGEGNKTADRNYREATQKFVESERGRKEIEKAGDVDEQRERATSSRPRRKRSATRRNTIRKRCASASAHEVAARRRTRSPSAAGLPQRITK